MKKLYLKQNDFSKTTAMDNFLSCTEAQLDFITLKNINQFAQFILGFISGYKY